MGRPRKRDIEKLAKEIAVLDRQRRARSLRYDEDALTDAERAFSALADSKGKDVFRSGWPDFLVLDRDQGSAICVEVKTATDEVRPSQRVMFEMLETVGLRVMIWSPEEPQHLVPWRKWDLDRRRMGPSRAEIWSDRTPALVQSRSREKTRG